MNFGKVPNPGDIDFTLPPDHSETASVLGGNGHSGTPSVYVGCAKWNRSDLKGFYPRGTKDELEYYATQFNAIELNATFHQHYTADEISAWQKKVAEHFRFFPKVNQWVSHLKWLNNFEPHLDKYLDSIVHFRDNLGTIFLQLRDNFKPKFFDRVVNFVEYWPKELPLAIEFRNTTWFNDPKVAEELYALLEENDVANVLVDTAGRRDLLHMRMTNNEAFIRFVGANHATDYDRLEDWAKRLKTWVNQGLENIHFFVHQNKEKASPRLSAHFIEHLNKQLGTDLSPPHLDDNE